MRNPFILNDHYKLITKIGERTYSVVCRAVDLKNNNKLVAIKRISKSKINNNTYLIESLKEELLIMKLIKCENSKIKNKICFNEVEVFVLSNNLIKYF